MPLYLLHSPSPHSFSSFKTPTTSLLQHLHLLHPLHPHIPHHVNTTSASHKSRQIDQRYSRPHIISQFFTKIIDGELTREGEAWGQGCGVLGRGWFSSAHRHPESQSACGGDAWDRPSIPHALYLCLCVLVTFVGPSDIIFFVCYYYCLRFLSCLSDCLFLSLILKYTCLLINLLNPFF